jgi:hypothetical protein
MNVSPLCFIFQFDEIESLGGQAIFFLVRGNKTYLYGTKDVVKAPTFTPNIEKFSTDLLNHCSDESDGMFYDFCT